MQVTNTILTLKPGLHLLRYPKNETASFVVAQAPGGSGQMQTLFTEGTQGNLLRNGSDCIVILVTNGSINLLISAILLDGISAIPSVRVDQVALEDNQTGPNQIGKQNLVADKKTLSSPKPFEVCPEGISIIGHIEAKGDVLAHPMEILGDVHSNLRLEGFQIVWPNKPKGIELNYSANLESFGLLPLVDIGTYCGTRGEARRINEVFFSLSGDNASQFALTGSAYFSGGFEIPIANNLRINGPSGLEHLIGLRLAIEPRGVTKKTKSNRWEDANTTTILKNDTAGSKKATKKVLQPQKKS
ncbi:MAG: hypothetical protein K2Y28_03350 [Burkholderiaceae bacterium]|nr:hypothetical protein [Burkholderiaceae bacterium]